MVRTGANGPRIGGDLPWVAIIACIMPIEGWTADAIDGGRSQGLVASLLESEFVSDPDHPGLVALTPELSPVQRKQRLGDGTLCVLGSVDGRAAGLSWAQRERGYIEYLDLSLELNPGVVYGFETYVDPAFRGRGIAQSLLLEKARRMLDLGIHTEVGAIMPENQAGLGMVTGQGRHLPGTLHCLRFGTNKRAWYTGRSPGWKPPFRIGLEDSGPVAAS